MKVETNEEEGCAVGVHISEESPVVYVSADVCDRGKGSVDASGVVYSEEEASCDLDN